MGLIDDIIIKLSGGAFSIAGLLNISAGSLVTERDKFITSLGVTKVIQITEMPYKYTQDLVAKITKQAAKENRGIVVKSYLEAEKCSIPINHPTFVNKANRAITKYAEYQKIFSSLDPIHQKAGVHQHNGMRLRSFGKKDVEKAKHVSDSFTEVRNHITQEGGVYFQTKLFIHLVFPDNNAVKAHFVSLKNFINSEVSKIEEISRKMGTYLMNMSPSTTNVQNISSSTILTSQESLTNLLPYSIEGLLSTKGVLLGTNVLRDTPFFIDIYSSPDGSTALVVGKAGSGKTTLCYHYALQKLGANETVVYLDIKGTAVTSVFSQLTDDYISIKFSGKDARFINPLVLDPHNSEYTMEDAVKLTADWLALMVDLQKNEGNEQDLLILLKAAVRGYYVDMKVSSLNVETYSRSANMELGRIVEYLGKNRNESTSKLDNSLYELAAKRILSLLQEYNMHRNDNAIDISSLFDYGAIVFDFNKNTEVSLSMIDRVRLYSAIFFVKQLSNYNKRNGNFTTVFADEGNQYLALNGLCEFISDTTARARSENTSVIFITNDLSVVKREEMSGFRSNIAIYAIGQCVDSDLEELAKLSSSKLLLADATEIRKNPARFRHSFAVASDLGGHSLNSIVRADLPKEIKQIFGSRTVLESEI